jgi:predicted nuclease of predicted toxin-antitoxin system
VKLLVDAQLPVRLARLLVTAGHDVVHSSELPGGNRTTDKALTDLADREGRVIVTKDRDFEISHLLRGEPRRLLLVTTGNIGNSALLELFESSLAMLDSTFVTATYVELSPRAMVVHSDGS